MSRLYQGEDVNEEAAAAVGLDEVALQLQPRPVSHGNLVQKYVFHEHTNNQGLTILVGTRDVSKKLACL